LINTSRGSVIDEQALASALEQGQISGAVIDVREVEPPVKGKLELLENFYTTPHIAAYTQAALGRVRERILKDVAAVLKGEQPAGLFQNEPD
jgi:phosphoglycerate dehydrogenase-like enzyme